MAEKELVRLNKYLSAIGFCSRRKADIYIDAGRITLNGSVPEMGTKVTGDEDIRLDGKKIIDEQEKPVYIAFNKPVGIVCTTDTRVEKDNIIDFIKYPTRIFPVGRLDKASEGLIFLTNDGDIVNKILRARNQHDKEYIVEVDKPINDRFIKEMSSGIPILDTVTRKCEVEQLGPKRFRIILTQGLNRQIRRMCEYLGYAVTRLKRVRIMNIHLDVSVGEYRDFTPDELNILKDTLAESTGTFKEIETLPKKETEKTIKNAKKPSLIRKKRRDRNSE